MAEYVAKRNPNRCPTHPGELLRDRGNSQFVPASAELAPRADPFSQKSALLHFPYPNGCAGELPAG